MTQKMKSLRCFRLCKRGFQAMIPTVNQSINSSLNSCKKKTLRQFLIHTMFWEVKLFLSHICIMLYKWLVSRMQKSLFKNAMKNLLKMIQSTKYPSFSYLRQNIEDKDSKIETKIYPEKEVTYKSYRN